MNIKTSTKLGQLFLVLLTGILFVLVDFIIRAYFDLGPISAIQKWSLMGGGMLISFIILFTRSTWLVNAYLILFSLMLIIDYLYLLFWGYWIFPSSTDLTGEKRHEVSEHFLIPGVLICINILGLFFIAKERRHTRYKSHWISVLGIVLLLFWPLKTIFGFFYILFITYLLFTLS